MSTSNTIVHNQLYRTKNIEKYHDLSYPKWKRLNLEVIEIPEATSFLPQEILCVHKAAGVRILPIEEALQEAAYQIFDEQEVVFGIDAKYTLHNQLFHNGGYLIHAKKGQRIEEPLYITYPLNEDHNVLNDYNLIIAEPDSHLQVVIEYRSEASAGIHNGVTKIFVGRNATVELTKVQNLDDQQIHLDATVSVVEEGGKCTFLSADLGAGVVATDYSAHLQAPYSETEVSTIYLGDGNRKLDIGYHVYHEGRKSKSLMDTKGALLDTSSKVYRGTLRFETGSAGSKGAEKESVILLDERVKADAIPALFCSEDDVEGAHAASAGQVNPNQLFYLMSRGFSENEAKKLIIHASFTPFLEALPLEVLKEAIELELSRRID